MYQDGLIVHVFVLYATFTGLHVCVNSDEGNGAEIIAASTATPLSVIIVILAALVVRDYLRRRRERQYRRQQLRNRLNMQQVHNRLAAPATSLTRTLGVEVFSKCNTTATSRSC